MIMEKTHLDLISNKYTSSRIPHMQTKINVDIKIIKQPYKHLKYSKKQTSNNIIMIILTNNIITHIHYI